MTHCLPNQVEKTRGREHHALGRAFFLRSVSRLPHTVLRTILCTVRIPSVRHAVFRLAAPSFSIFPSHARTVKHHPLCPIFPHPTILFPHHPFPSPMLHSSPSSRPARPPSFSFPVFPPVFALQKRKSKKLQKNAKKVLTNRTWGGIISKLSAREQPLQQRRHPFLTAGGP